MNNIIIRPYDHERDLKAIQRSWMEIGWLEDKKKTKKAMGRFASAGPAWVAEFNGEAEAFASALLGDMRYLDETLSFGGVSAVTNSIIVRKQGVASRVTARLLAQLAAEGVLVSGLGIFEQGFYNRLGFGNGSYENRITFDPAALIVEHPFRPPTRLSTADWHMMHDARLKRRRPHGTINLYPPAITRLELALADNIFGLGYFDGPEGELSHHMVLNADDDLEEGPYNVWWMSYQSREQFLELLAVLKSLGDQVGTISMEEPPGIHMQDFIKQPFRSRLLTRKSDHETGIRTRAYWQLRLNDVAGCMAKTHLPHADVHFNLQLSDPIGRYLPDDAPWQGTAGEYLIYLGPNSAAELGHDPALPTLTASINAFTRLWMGIVSATNLAISDSCSAPEDLLAQLDRALCLPIPKPDWDY